MSATVIDGKAVAAEVRAEVKAEVEGLISAGARRPGLATVLVGDDPASAIYVAGKHRACAEVGIESFGHELPAGVEQAEVEALLRELNADPRVSGILLQLPTPDHIDGSYLTTLIDPGKDVDGLTPISTGLLVKGRPGLRPCTPAGVMELLKRYDVALQGAEAVVVGRSDLVGKPVAAMLLAENATVTTCHSRTQDLPAVCRRADVLIAAVGRDRMIKGDWVKPGAAVIDVGMNRTDEGLFGDVDFESVSGAAAYITPVPGGVGPMTIAMLLVNTLQAARGQG
jgi:methylenetetrahydrofolate dehydrogenase (NADP+)/methenyltetrahydrofolate cyclohydrolase